MQKFIVTITDPGEPIVNDENAVCHVLNSELPAARLKELIAELRRTESLILVSGPGAVSLCREQNLDGVVAEINVDAPYKKQILPLREALGHKKALGVVIPLSRHAAMIVGETEPEFVAFRVDSAEEAEKAGELLAWYNELFLIQAAVCGKADSSVLTGLDADFVMISPRNFKILVAKKESLD